MLLQKSYSSKIPMEEKVEAQQKLIKILFSRFKAEEYERLKTEEQTADMVAEEEKTISFLEKKIKDLEQMVSQQKQEQLQDRQQLKKILESSGVAQKQPEMEVAVTEEVITVPLPIEEIIQQEEGEDEETSDNSEDEIEEKEEENREEQNEEPSTTEVETITIPKLNLTILTNLIDE